MSVSGPGRVIDNGLVLYLDASNNKSIVSGSNTWFDVSRNGNNGTLTNGPTFSSGNGGSIVFDGTNDYISTQNITLNTNTGFTVDLWIYIDDPQPVYASFWSYFYSNGNSFFEWGTYASGSAQGKFIVKDNGAVGGPSLVSPYIGNSWGNVIFGCNATTPFLYINGTTNGVVTEVAGNFRNTNITIANLFRGGASLDRYYKSRSASIKIYNRALSPSEILQNYNLEKKRFGL